MSLVEGGKLIQGLRLAVSNGSTRVYSPPSLFSLNMEACVASKMLDFFDPEMADSVQNFSRD